VSTVKRQFLNADLKRCVAVSKPFLKVINKKNKAWLGSATQKLDSGRLEQCSLEWWSKFEIFGTKRRVFVQYLNERVADNCSGSVKHGGGSVMVWRCFGGLTVRDLIKIEGILQKNNIKNYKK